MNRALFNVAINRSSMDINQFGGIGDFQELNAFLAQRAPDLRFDDLGHAYLLRPVLTGELPRNIVVSSCNGIEPIFAPQQVFRNAAQSVLQHRNRCQRASLFLNGLIPKASDASRKEL